jgi:NADPH:quinone reductase-like Zn-dependent oxidoreductase
MKAVRFHEFGGTEVLRVEDVQDPSAGPGEVVIDVRACAFNHLDVDVRNGVSRFPVTLPHTLGFEAVGTIAEIGLGVDGGFEVGDRVLPFIASTCGECGLCRTGRPNLCLRMGFLGFSVPGAMAEQVRCEAQRLIRVPDELTDEEAASVQAAFGTSWHMLFARAGLTAGETVLISSVGSGIGSAALQLAKLAGAFVIGTASSDDKLARAKALGLDVGINYREQSVVDEVLKETDGRGVDLVYEHVGGDALQWGLDSLVKDGRLVTCGAHGGEVVPFDIIPFFRSQKRLIASFLYTKEEVSRCLDLAARGVVKPVVGAVFPLAEVRAATELMERREHFGKIIVKPDGTQEPG